MSKEKDLQTQIGIMASGSGSTGGNTAQDRLAALLEVKLQKEFQEEKKQAEQAEMLRESQLAAIRENMKQTAARQEECPHMKPNFRPALGGQKDHQGHYHFICQYCMKEFGDNVPYHLRISGEMVGGPI